MNGTRQAQFYKPDQATGGSVITYANHSLEA